MKLSVLVCFVLILLKINGAIAQQIYASPNPIIVPNSTTLGATTVYVNVTALGYQGHTLEVYADNTPPFGTLFAEGGTQFSATTGPWVTDGTTFFLVDKTTGKIVDGISIHLATQPESPSPSGCQFGPFTACVDSTPATNLSGVTWIDEGSNPGGTGSLAEWTITANTASPASTEAVSGSVLVFPPAYPTCPYVVWQVSGTYSPSSVVAGQPGSTQFTWVAANPSPAEACGGFVPTPQMTYSGAIRNATNDFGQGTWANGQVPEGNFQLFADPYVIPAGEDIEGTPAFGAPGAGSTVLSVSEAVQDTEQQSAYDPHENLFQGRQVFETLTAGQPTLDACQNAAAGTAPFGAFTVQGSIWNLDTTDEGDDQGYVDGVGWYLPAVQWYQKYLPASSLPCTATVYQTMNILTSDPTHPLGGAVVYSSYASHTITATINNNFTVTVTKDGKGGTAAFSPKQ